MYATQSPVVLELTEPSISSRDDTPAGPSKATVELAVRGALVDVRLAAPDQRNALRAGDHRFVSEHLRDWARSPDVYAMMISSRMPGVFSIGTSLEEMAEVAAQGVSAIARHSRIMYELYWQLECFTKPIISFVDGHSAGAGNGLFLFGTHRVGGAGFRLAVPEVGLGLVPQAGVAHVLGRMPNNIGMYLALTGRGLSRADALALGVLTHAVDGRLVEDIARRLADAEPVDQILDGLAHDPGPRDLDLFQELIGRCFAAASVEEIVELLMRERGPLRPWADQVIKDVLRQSPLALKATHRLIRLSQSVGLRETMLTTHGVLASMFAGEDFREGLRAAVLELDRSPRWRRSSLGDIKDKDVDALFRPLSSDALALPKREDLQFQRY